MRRKGSSGDGVFLCFVFNLLFNFWWGVLTFILWVLFLWLRIPLILVFIGLLIWVTVALVSTWLVIWGVKSSENGPPPRANLNPYSAKTSDIFGTANTPANETDLPSADENVLLSANETDPPPVGETDLPLADENVLLPVSETALPPDDKQVLAPENDNNNND